MRHQDHIETAELRQESGELIADSVARQMDQAAEYGAISTGGVLFCAEMTLHRALRALRDVQSVMEVLGDREDAPELPYVGLAAAESLIARLHGAVRRAQT